MSLADGPLSPPLRLITLSYVVQEAGFGHFSALCFLPNETVTRACEVTFVTVDGPSCSASSLFAYRFSYFKSKHFE